MARRRFFVDRIHNLQAELSGEEAHHLTRVLRVEEGQQYEITDGRDIFLAEVAEAHKSRVVFHAKDRIEPKPEALRLTLFLALVKFERMEWTFEKGTELGVSRFVPVIAQRSEKGLDRAVDKRMERWRRIVLEASQQCRRDHLPEITDAVPFSQAIEQASGIRLFADEAPGVAPIAAAVEPRITEASLLIGPEGGWTDGERALALRGGWAPVSLGPLVLRAETAALAASAWLMLNSLAPPERGPDVTISL